MMDASTHRSAHQARQSGRLAAGGLVDRAVTPAFTFDGVSYQGHGGDTLASALLANGVRLVGRSFKYHRPRGILSAGVEEPNALVELRGGARREPNTRATMVELHEGLEAASQNRWPTLGHDLMAVNSLLAPVFAAGFYYKTFMWPASFWEKVYEPLIRRAAGLGRAATEPDPDRYERATTFCDVLVVGAGPAGLCAALAAGRAGARVILCEEDFRLGGRLLCETDLLDGKPAADWVAEAGRELAALPHVRVLTRTCVFGAYDGGVYGAVERVGDHLAAPQPHGVRQRYWRINARRAVVATGAIERAPVFGDNDRPGVMLAGAVRAYVNRFAVAPGRKAVVFVNNDHGLRTVNDLSAAGIEVAAVVDPRADGGAARVAAEAAGTTLLAGAAVTRAIGRKGVRAVEIAGAEGTRRIECDLLAVSGGWNPTLHLTSHLGHRPVWNDALAAFVPDALAPGMRVAGAASGKMTLAACLSSGAEAGLGAACETGFTGSAGDLPAASPESLSMTALWRVRGSCGKAFVDFQNDVTDKDVELAEREGFRSVEHMKRYTTLGMATDQGKTGGVNAMALMSELSEQTIAQTGTTTYRPPFAPVAIGVLAGHARGESFRPVRLTPSHEWARMRGAAFIEAGSWLRAQYFPREGEADWLETVAREVRTVRSAVGLCDVSTLGKIDVQGGDALTFLQRLYANDLGTLKVGKVRYGLMLREDGFVMDDGTVARLSEERFLITTTTAQAPRVLSHLEYCRQWHWPELDVASVPVTEHWAQYALAGPNARAVLERIVDPGCAVDDEAVPYMACRALAVCGGVAARLFRVSFCGELGYEIAVPARYGGSLWRAILSAGEPFGIAPYGTEALSAMRIEKGHPAGGELNGHTTAADLGLGRMTSRKKDYIGRRMAARPALGDPGRPALVGVKPLDPDARLHAGAHFLAPGAEARTENDEGHMTSVAYSPGLRRWIGLALVRRGAERIGERLRAYDPLRGADVAVELCDRVFYDPEGERLRG